MKLEVGESYQTRDGRTFTIIEDRGKEVQNTRFLGRQVGDGCLLSFTLDGQYTGLSEHPADLVERVVPGFKMEVGKSYITRDGGVYQIFAETPGVAKDSNQRFVGVSSQGYVQTWSHIGGWSASGLKGSHDLVKVVPEPVTVERFMAVTLDDLGNPVTELFYNRLFAELCLEGKQFAALVPISITVTNGEGL